MSLTALPSSPRELPDRTDSRVPAIRLPEQGGPDVVRETLPIVYSPEYDIDWPRLGVHQTLVYRRRSRLAECLAHELGTSPSQFVTPNAISLDALREVHTEEYLQSLSKPSVAAQVMEQRVLENASLPALNEALYRPLRFGVGGTLHGCALALEHGWAINLSGGFHHAQMGRGEGLCIYSDIGAALELLTHGLGRPKVLVVDLDAHLGNGTLSFLARFPESTVFDLYNGEIYPSAVPNVVRPPWGGPLRSGTTDKEYLAALESLLPAAVGATKPDFILYLAGTDVHCEDPFGRMSLTDAGVAARDKFVFGQALSTGTPILTVLAGAYGARSPEVAARALAECLRHYELVRHPSASAVDS